MVMHPVFVIVVLVEALLDRTDVMDREPHVVIDGVVVKEAVTDKVEVTEETSETLDKEEGEFDNTLLGTVKYRQCILPLGENGKVEAILGGMHFKVFIPEAR